MKEEKKKTTTGKRRGKYTYKPISIIAKPFVPHKFHSSIELLSIPDDAPKPIIVISPQAYADMFMLVDIMDIEVGWLASVIRDGYLFYIEEIFVPEQTANSGTCNLHTDGQAKLFQDLFIQRPDGIEVVNCIRFWGHSHHSMGSGASPQDETQMMELAEGCGDYFIRAILTKHGMLELTLILYDENYRINDVPWRTLGIAPLHDPVRRAFWQKLTDELVALEEYKVERCDEFHGAYYNYLAGLRGISPDALVTFPTLSDPPVGAHYRQGEIHD